MPLFTPKLKGSVAKPPRDFDVDDPMKKAATVGKMGQNKAQKRLTGVIPKGKFT